MRDLLSALERERSDAVRGVRPAIVEVSPRMRGQQSLALEGRDLRWASVAHSLAPIKGVLFANEVLDAFPVHVLIRTPEGVRELFVGEENGALVEVLRAPSQDLRWRVPESVPLGGRWETSPAAEGWVASLAGTLVSGYVVLVDYGGEETDLLTRDGAGTIRGFARHPPCRGRRGTSLRGIRDAARGVARARHPRGHGATVDPDRATARGEPALGDRRVARSEWVGRVQSGVFREGCSDGEPADVRRDQRYGFDAMSASPNRVIAARSVP